MNSLTPLGVPQSIVKFVSLWETPIGVKIACIP